MNNLNRKNKINEHGASPVNQKRRIITKIGAVTPVILSLASKSALGDTPYHCTISGMHSGNTSSHGDKIDCGVGFSPGGWKQNAFKKSNGDLSSGPDGNVNQWLATGVIPFSIRYCAGKKEILVNGVWQENVDVFDAIYNLNHSGTSPSNNCGTNSSLEAATLFSDIFIGSPIIGTMWEVLYNNPGSIEFHAIADWLNASLADAVPGVFGAVYDDIDPGLILVLYNHYINGWNYTTSSGQIISPDLIREYLESIHH